MTVIPQRTLRNEVGDVLRRTEAGEHFVITVSGRPVAELGPVTKTGPQRFVPAHVVNELLASLPRVTGLREELDEAVDSDLHDPFE